MESSFNDTIIQTNILISNGVTSVCIESLLLGIPVIILAKNNGFTYIPTDDYNKLLSVCYTHDEIIKSINNIAVIIFFFFLLIIKTL